VNIQKNSAKKIIVFVAATNVCSNYKVFIHRIDIFFLIRFEDCRDYLFDEFEDGLYRKLGLQIV
jgi:hypothetical protein